MQWLRTFERPCQRILDEHGAALLDECSFYGESSLPQVIRGELAPDCYLRASDRALMRAEEEAICNNKARNNMLIDVHSASTEPRERAELGQPLLFLDRAPRPAREGDFHAFYMRLNEFSGGLVEELKGIPNLVFAGGSVTAALVGGRAGDLDIFLTCAVEEGEARLRAIYTAVPRLHTKANPQKQRFLATRSARAVTFYLRSSPGTPPIQVITSTHESTQDILLHFDLDSACFAYSPTEGERVVCTPRGLRALQYSANIVHGTYSGPNYCRRLETYSQRGFVVALPGYAPSKVSPNFLSGTYGQFRGRDSLYRLGPKRHRMETVQITHVDHNSSSAKSECVRVAAMQSARAVIDVQRLIVLDRLAPIALDPPEVQFCAKHERHYVSMRPARR